MQAQGPNDARTSFGAAAPAFACGASASPGGGADAEHEIFDRLLVALADAALGVVPAAEVCAIHLLQEDGTNPKARTERRQGTADVPSFASLVAPRRLDELLRRVLREGRALCLAGTGADRAGDQGRRASLLVAPLAVDGVPLGTISLGSRRATFGPKDAARLSALAGPALLSMRLANQLCRAEQERQAVEQILGSLSDGLVVLDDEGRITCLNRTAYQLLGLSPDDISLPWSPKAATGGPDRLWQLVCPSGGRVVGAYEVTLNQPSGTVVLHVTVSELRGPFGGEARVIRDVTGERESRRRFDLFISQISHELRTPLQHITSFVNLLSEINDLSPGERAGFLSNIQDEAMCLARLVDDLAQLSRIEAARFSVRLERVGLDQFVANIVGKLHYRAENHGLTLAHGHAECPLPVRTDPIRLEQVLSNLLENAFKYVPAGGTVRVSVEPGAREAMIHISDDGPGIAPDLLPHVFEQFSRGEPDASRGTGMGLGLFISQQITRALGGEIGVQSQVGEGTTFTIRLPRLED